MAAEITQLFQWNAHSIPVAVVSTVIFLVGLFIFIQNPKSVTNASFFLICLCVNAWLYGNALMYAAKTPEIALTCYRRITFLGVSYVSTCVYMFSAIWLKLYREQKLRIMVGLVGSGIFYLVGIFSPLSFQGVYSYYWGYYPQYGPLNYCFIVFFFSYFLEAFYNFIQAYRSESNQIRRTQIRLIAIAFLISLTGSVDYLPKIIYLGVYPFGYISVFFWIMLVAYSIIKYKVMDIQTVIHKTLMWFTSTLVAVSPFTLLIYVTRDWTRGLNSMHVTFYYLVLFVAFYFYFRMVQPQLDHVFQRRRANLQSVLNRFSDELAHLKNLRDLLQGLVRLLWRSLYTRRISVYLRSESDQELAPAIVKRIRGLKPFPVHHEFLSWLERHDEVVVADLIETDPEAEAIQEVIRDYFSKVEAEVAVPFVLGGKLIGVLHVGKKENLRRYTPAEIHFLTQLKGPMAIAFSNSLRLIEMQETYKRWNEELEKKVDERTRQLQDTQAQLVQAEKLATIGTLAGGVAHEINNPLTAVLTNAQILKMDAKKDDLESLSLIEEGAKRCQVIVQKLMKYSRKPAGQEKISSVDIHRVIESAMAFLKYQLNQENIELITRRSEGELTIQGNANEIEQIVTNLILNAKDAIKQTSRPGRIEIETCEKNGAAQIQVRDNGIGIPKEHLAKIFDPFFTTKEIGKGTGLGLAVTYGIVQKHAGKIEVFSDEGKGTSFAVLFPLRKNSA